MKKQNAKKSTQDRKEKSVMLGYPVGDFLIRVKNAVLGRKKAVSVARTKLIERTAKALAKEGYVSDVKAEGKNLTVTLTYRKKEPLMLGMKLVSKPGLRVYIGVEDLEKRRKPSTLLISTPKGVVSAKDAIAARVGGEVIVEVW